MDDLNAQSYLFIGSFIKVNTGLPHQNKFVSNISVLYYICHFGVYKEYVYTFQDLEWKTFGFMDTNLNFCVVIAKYAKYDCLIPCAIP